MAWTVATFQNQVQSMTGHSNLNARVLTWVNRVLMELAGKAYWNKNIHSTDIGCDTTAYTATGADSRYVAVGTTVLHDAIDIHRIDYGTTAPLVRHGVQDIFSYGHGLNVSNTTGDFARYAVVKWASATSGGAATFHMYPEIMVQPMTTTVTNAMAAYYLAAPDKLTTTGGNHWFTNKYPRTVLAGVLRYAYLYLNDLQSYLLWKGEYENGIKDMLMNEETVMASTPAMRGITPGAIMRGGYQNG